MAKTPKEPKPTAAIVLDTRRQKQDGTYPLRLRVTFQRDRKYYSVKLPDLTQPEWEKLNGERLRDEKLREIRDKIKTYESDADTVLKDLSHFTFARFEKDYFADHTIDTKARAEDVYHAFEEQIKKMAKQGSASTASIYQTTLNSLKGFKPRLRFEEVTASFLEKYDDYLTGAGKSVTTVSIYLRNLRTIVNQAKAKGIIAPEEYPFGKNQYEVPAARNVKKALTLSEIEKIYQFSTEVGSLPDRAKDFWFFSYLCNGINVKDICRLRWKDIDGDRVSFIRAKTARTKRRNQKAVVVILTDVSRAILDKWGTKHRLPDNYVFPILPMDVTPQRERELVQYLTRSMNKYVGRMAIEIGIDKPVTTYTARHSFSTVLKRSGAPIEFISESLGHHDLRTTENYLDSFEDDVKRQYASNLLNFKS
ncbi:tyrosine-type recombinase/integrase [Spirosoma sp. HMF4905]|uniref:Tyrosine-type recombinase/integrase n=1 Tax=Spirosoma arboris TaxID=2682092 RepID=A0A7K1SBI0_9BACT|nr:site-specific integrase [Spirosoma arboris]MVM31172.1 tyrosine-type recombinase/integrase [Spirosoma arboris]